MFETIFVDPLPASHPEMFLVVRFNGEKDSEHDIKIKIVSPNKESLIPNNTQSIKVKVGSNGTGNLLHRMLGLPLSSAGDYEFEIWENEKKLSVVKLPVIKAAPIDRTTLN